jgi:predicted PurR-regulated permease PerM
MPEAPSRRTALVIPWTTLLKVVVVAALIWLWFQLYQIVLVLIVAIVLAVTLNPAVEALQRRRWPRWAASLFLSTALCAGVIGFFWMSWSSLNAQAHLVTEHLSIAERDVLERLPEWMRVNVKPPNGSDVTSYLAPYALKIAQSTMTAVAYGVLGFILMIYLLIEADNTRDWLLAFVSAQNRAKAEITLRECERVIVAYAIGNALTSLFAFAVAYMVLLMLKVPAALLLAITAGIADFVPVMGFIVSAVPAIVLATTVSTAAALTVAIAYASYHAIENYFIGPLVYGEQLKLSNVAILMAFAIGAEIAGVIGALIALPVAAVYPTIERIWLRDQVGEKTVREHREIARKIG